MEKILLKIKMFPLLEELQDLESSLNNVPTSVLSMTETLTIAPGLLF